MHGFTLNNIKDRLARLRIFRQEHETRSVSPLFRHRNTLQKNKFMRNLYHYASTVTGFRVGTLGATVYHVLQHLEALLHKAMTFYTSHIHEQANSTGIVLISRII